MFTLYTQPLGQSPSIPGMSNGNPSSCLPQVIYMARNPKDLVVSYYQFHRSLRTMSYRGTFQEFCRRFMNDKCKCHRVCVPCPITTSQCWGFLGSHACNGTPPATVQLGLELSIAKWRRRRDWGVVDLRGGADPGTSESCSPPPCRFSSYTSVLPA